MSPSQAVTFTKNVITLTSATAIAQIVTILVAPVLTRLYGPEAFGLLALFMSITSVISIVACLRYELSILLPESDEDAINILGLCLIIVVVISLLTIPVIWFGQNLFCQMMHAPSLAPYLWLVPPFVFISGVYSALNYWNTRSKKYVRLSMTRISSSVTTNGTQVGAGLSGCNGGGCLIGAYVLGIFIATLTLGVQILRDDYSAIKRNLNLQKMKECLVRYKKFPLIDTISTVLNAISWQLPTILLSSFFSPVIAGFYALGYRLIHSPMSFIGSSLSQVFFQQAVEAKNKGTLSSFVENIFKILVVVGLFPILILTFIGKDLFSIVFGPIWAEAGVYTQILSIWALVWFISSPLSLLYCVLEKQEFGLKYNIANFFTRLVSLIIGGLLGSPIIALLLFAISGIIMYGYLCFMMLEYSRVNRQHSLQIILTNLLRFIPVGTVLMAMILLNVCSLMIVISGVFFCLGYYAYIINTESQIKSLVLSLPLIKNISSIRRK